MAMSDGIVEAVLEGKRKKDQRREAEKKEGTVPRWWSLQKVPLSKILV